MIVNVETVAVDLTKSISVEDMLDFHTLLPAMKKARALAASGSPMTRDHFISYTHKVGTKSFSQAVFLCHEFARRHPDVLQFVK